MLRWISLCLIGLAAAAAAAAPANRSESTEPGSLEKSIVTNNTLSIGQRTFLLPFTTRLSTPLVNGQTVHAIGTINSNATEIEFAFLNGSSKGADMPLHLSIRFYEGIIIYKTFINGTWSVEEQRMNNTFKPGREFDIRVRIIDNKYHVFANRKDIGKFDIRQPLGKIDHVSIRGDLDALHRFHYGGQVFPEKYASYAFLVPGKRLDISGVPTGKRFNVNHYGENQEYTLKMSVNFVDKVIARNAQENNVWGKEESEGGFPLNKGDVFDLTLLNDQSAIQIYVNGKLFSSFKHRGKHDDYKTLEVEGDVELHSATIKDVVTA